MLTLLFLISSFSTFSPELTVTPSGKLVKVNESFSLSFNLALSVYRVFSSSLITSASCNAFSPGVTSFTFNSTSNS